MFLVDLLEKVEDFVDSVLNTVDAMSPDKVLCMPIYTSQEDYKLNHKNGEHWLLVYSVYNTACAKVLFHAQGRVTLKTYQSSKGAKQ